MAVKFYDTDFQRVNSMINMMMVIKENHSIGHCVKQEVNLMWLNRQFRGTRPTSQILLPFLHTPVHIVIVHSKSIKKRRDN